MTTLLLFAVCIGLCSAFFVTLFKKFGVWEYLQSRIPGPWGCDFCLNFWLCLLALIILSLFALPPHWPDSFIVLLMATTIGRHFTP